MPKLFRSRFLFLVTGLIFIPAAVFCREAVPIRIGWQTSWATQGQAAMVLKNTNILELNGLKGEFKGFTYGGPLNEGALAGELDVIFTADQPACMLLARGAKWKIVGRLMYSRVGTIVPPDSPVKTTAGLKGKSVGIPFGAAAQRETLRALKEAGLDPMKDVTILNIGINEQIPVIQKGDNGAWPGIDAFSTWDPTMAELILKNKARVLDQALVTSAIVMSDDFIAKQPRAAAGFLKSYITAFYYYAAHQAEANSWFRDAAKLELAPEVLDQAASVEPNLKAAALSGVNIALSDNDIRKIQSAADFNFSQKLAVKPIKDVKKFINTDLLKKAVKELASPGNGDYLSRIKPLPR